jgi:predicted RNA-binding Zn ribbon-like protein
MMDQTQFLKQGFGKHSPWVDLVNSEDWDGLGRFTDHLQNPGWLPSFLRHWKLPALPSNSRSFAQIKKLRSVLRRAAEKMVIGHPLASADLTDLNAAMNVPAHQALVRRGATFETALLPARMDWKWVLSRIASSFAETVAQTPRGRVKICANSPLCRWFFYDITKGNTRRWCSGRTCGNRFRVRQARALRKHRSGR